jgi:hypothetical protein
VARRVWFCGGCWAAAVSVRDATAQSAAERARLVGMDFIYHEVRCEDVLPDGPTARGAALRDLFPFFGLIRGLVLPLVGGKLIALAFCGCERW